MSHAVFLSRLREKIKTANGRLVSAMICYAILIGIALEEFLPARSAGDRFLLAAVLGVFALLIVKTWVHFRDEKPD